METKPTKVQKDTQLPADTQGMLEPSGASQAADRRDPGDLWTMPLEDIVGSSPGELDIDLVVGLGTKSVFFGQIPVDPVVSTFATDGALGWDLVE